MNLTPQPLDRRAVLKGLAGAAAVLGAGGGAGLIVADPAYADTSTFDGTAHRMVAPRFFTCAEWRARPGKPWPVLNHRPTYIVVHHTAMPNSADTSLAHAFNLSRQIQADHMDHNGFDDTGQHFTNSRGGYLMEGAHRSLDTLRGGREMVQAAHCLHHNGESIGIENEGTYTSVRPPPAQYNSLVRLCAYICHQYKLPPNNIKGHRDFNQTACPGDVLHGMLPQLRKDVGRALA